MEGLDPGCAHAQLLAEILGRRANVAAGLEGSRLAEIVREQQERGEARHLAACPQCQAWSRTCSRCRRGAERHSFFCRDNPRRWRTLLARRRPSPPGPHEVLGVPKGASADDIRRAYRTLALRHHPDRLAKASARKRRKAEARMREINAAYTTLRRAFASCT